MTVDDGVQNLPTPATIHEAASRLYSQQQISIGNNDSSPTATSDRPTAWPYPSMSNETHYLQQDNDPNAFTYQPTEDDVQTNQLGLVTPVSPLSTCSSSRMSNVQDSFIQQPYSREHLFFESTPREANNQAMFNNPP